MISVTKRTSNGVKKVVLIIFAVMFTAQACNFLYGDFGGSRTSGSRGIFLSADSGRSWQQPKSASRDLSLSNVAISSLYLETAKPNNLLAASVSQGVLASSDKGETWGQLLPNFAARGVLINPANDQEIIAGGSAAGQAAIWHSRDRGKTWFQIYSEPAGNSAITALLAAVGSTFYAGSSAGIILKTTDNGNTWTISGNIENPVLKLTQGQSGLYALTGKDGVWHSADNGNTWTRLPISRRPGNFYSLAVDADRLYAGTETGLFRSTNGGTTWDKMNLPVSGESSAVTAVTVNPKNRQQIYAAVRTTVFRSDDLGVSWNVSTLPTQRTVWNLIIDPEEPNRIYAGLR